MSMGTFHYLRFCSVCYTLSAHFSLVSMEVYRNPFSCYPKDAIYAFVGQNLKIACTMDVKPFSEDPIGKWTKNGEPLSVNNNTELLSTILLDSNIYMTSVEFRKLDRSDTGLYLYTCIYDGMFILSNNTLVVVQPMLSSPMCYTSKKLYITGDNATLMCETYSYHGLNLYWYIPSSQLGFSPKIGNSKSGDNTTTTLTFKTAKISESVFTCIMELEEWIEPLFCDLEVIVKAYLSVKITVRSTIEYGEKAVLYCGIGNSVPVNNTMKDLQTLWFSENLIISQYIENNNSSNILVIQEFVYEMIGAVVSCTVTVNKSEGSDSVVLVENLVASATEASRPKELATKIIHTYYTNQSIIIPKYFMYIGIIGTVLFILTCITFAYCYLHHKFKDTTTSPKSKNSRRYKKYKRKPLPAVPLPNISTVSLNTKPAIELESINNTECVHDHIYHDHISSGSEKTLQDINEENDRLYNTKIYCSNTLGYGQSHQEKSEYCNTGGGGGGGGGGITVAGSGMDKIPRHRKSAELCKDESYYFEIQNEGMENQIGLPLKII